MNNSVPKDWQVSKIGELIQKVIDNRGKTPPLSDKGKELIEINCIENYKFPNYDLIKKYVSNKTYNSWFRGGHPKKGDILVSTVGSIGQFSIMNDNRGCIAQNIIAITPKKNICNDYLYYACSSDIIKKAISSVLMGAVQPSLKVPDFLAINLHLPSLPEQKKIAFILTSVDEVIEKTQLQINKLQDLKKGMMDDLLTSGIGHSEFNNSILGRIPKEWKVVDLKDNLSFISYGFTNPMPESEFGHFLVTAKDIFDGKIAYETARKTTPEAFRDLLTRKSRPKINDILLTKDGTLGRVALVDKEGICINQSVAILTPNKNVLSRFLYYLLSFAKYQKEMLNKAGGSTIKHIYITVVDKMKVATPPIPEQQKIVSILSSIDTHINKIQKKLNKNQSLKKSLMQDLLTGKVRVSVN